MVCKCGWMDELLCVCVWCGCARACARSRVYGMLRGLSWKESFFEAIVDYQDRERRFGKTTEQLGINEIN